MMVITSRANDLIKSVRSLKEKKYRDETGTYLIEGVKLVREALALHLPVVRVLGTKDGLDAAFDGIQSSVEKAEVSESVFEAISDTVTPQGVLAVCRKPVAEKKPVAGKAVFLDGVADAGNVGTILRSAAATGVSTVFAASSADPFSPKSVRASMGGLFRINVLEGTREELLPLVKSPLIVASMEGENAFTAHLPTDFCLVVGNEANGVSDTVKSAADTVLSLPMQNGVESLNAGVSCSVLLYLLTNLKR